MQKFKTAFLLVAFTFFITASAASAATLTLSPTSNSVNIGGTFAVNVVLDTQGAATYGVDIDSLHFNPAILQVVDADSGTTGVQIAPGSLMSSNSFNAVNNSTGLIQFSQTPSTGASNFTGSGILATITFQAVAAGTSAVTFDYTPGATTDSNVAGLYTDLLSGVANGSYTVNIANDITAPSVPTGLTALGASQTSVNLSWAASTDPVVGGQTTSGIGGYKIYRGGVQVGTSTTTSFTDTGLVASTTYSYRVAAYDNAGNVSAQTSAVNGTTSANLPIISSVLASGIGQAGATISWSTNVATNGQIKYGLTSAYGSTSAVVDNSPKKTSHSITLAGLVAGTTYHYQAVSVDASNNTATSSDNTFATQSAPDTTAPTVNITNPASSGQGVSGVISVSSIASDPTIAGQVTSGLQSESLLVDGTVFASSSAGALTANLDTTAMVNNTHTLTATARDNAGNTTTSAGVTINVFNLANATRYPRAITLSSLEGMASIPGGTQITAVVIAPLTQVVLQTQTLSPSATGTYVATFQTTFPQVVNIRVSSPGYLSQLFTNIDTTVLAGSVLNAPQLLAGDLNSDNVINSLDYSIVNTHWLQNFAQADLNGDGLVNSLDFAILKNNFGKTGQ